MWDRDALPQNGQLTWRRPEGKAMELLLARVPLLLVGECMECIYLAVVTAVTLP